MKKFIKQLLLATGVLLASSTAQSAIDLVNDDTDIFMVNPAVSSQRPNVLLMVDNSANWNASAGSGTKRDNEMDAIKSVVGGLTDQFNVGLMLWMEGSGSNPSSAENSAAYVRYGIRQMLGSMTDVSPLSNKSRLGNLLISMKTSGNDDQSSSSFAYSVGLFEAYRYFRGQQSYPNYGAVANARDFTGNTNSRSAPYISGLTDNPLVSAASTTYRSPISDKCQKNFIILISNGKDGGSSNQGKGFDRLAEVFSEVSLGSPSEITPTSSLTIPTADGSTASAVPESGVWIDEWASYMANNDCGPGTSTTKRPVYTYVIDVDPAPAKRDFSALLFNTAKEGKGKYIPVSNNASALTDALNRIFQEIQAVNSVFASTTLPVSNNVRGTSLNQVYIGVFRPDGNRLPRWYGNLKLYKLGTNLDKLVGQDGQDVYNETSGFAFNTAESFWTTDSSFWSFRSIAGYEASDVGKESDQPDGDLVEKGAAAQRLREVYATASDINNRKVYTCVGGACTAGASLSTMAFNNANTDVTATALKAFGTIALSSVTSSGTLATATTASAHGLGSTGATVTGVTIDGVSPTNYNGASLTVTVTGATTFTYTLASPPTDTTALVSATAHGLSVGDTVTVTGATPSDYNVSNASVLSANFSANQFAYTMPSAASVAATGAAVVGRRPFANVPSTSISGTGGTNTATVYWPGHGFASSPSGGVTISGSTAGGGVFNVSGVTIGGITANGFTYTTTSAIPVSGTTTTVTATAAAHGLGANGATVNNVAINCGGCVYQGTHSVTILTANSFQYVVTGAFGSTSGAYSFSVSSSITGSVSLTNGSGGTRSTATGTVAAGHGLGSSSPINVTISSVSPLTGNNAKFSLDSPYSATITNSTQFTYAMSCSGGSCPTATTSVGATYSASWAKSGSITNFTPAATVVTDTASISSSMAMAAKVTTSSITVIQSGNTTGATVGSPASVDATLRTNIINWVRGQDNKENENLNTGTTAYTDVRSSIHGDVLHSRPAVVNYGRNGSTDTNDIYVFYGTNDGMFRAAKGGFASGAGNEAWSFVAPEFFGALKRQRDNAPAVSGAKPRDYFFDGPVSIYTKDVNGDSKLKVGDGDKVYLYAAMRRGGRMIYALDVSDPDDPKFLWKKGCPNQDNDTGCTAGWETIGQTWSEPRIAYVRAHTNPVLMFSGGYEPAVEDFQPCTVTANTSAAVTGYKNSSLTYYTNGACWAAGVAPTTVNRNKGRGIFIVDAITGDIVWRVGPDAAAVTAGRQVAGMTYAMPADLSVLNRDRDVQARTVVENVNGGFIDRIYAVDTGANIWRLDLDHADKNFWAVKKLASLGGSLLENKAKFLYSPRVTNDPQCGNFDAIVIGSGDREHPFSAGFYPDPSSPPGTQTFTAFKERFYMVKDYNQGLVNPNGTLAAAKVADTVAGAVTRGLLTDLTNDCIGSCSTTATDALSSSPGWLFELAEGEKVVTSATVQGALVQFATNQPSGSAGNANCDSDLGVARAYKVNFCNALSAIPPTTSSSGLIYSRSVNFGDGGLPPSPTPAIVCEGALCKEVSCFGANCGEPVPLKLNARVRTYWYKKGGS